MHDFFAPKGLIPCLWSFPTMSSKRWMKGGTGERYGTTKSNTVSRGLLSRHVAGEQPPGDIPQQPGSPLFPHPLAHIQGALRDQGLRLLPDGQLRAPADRDRAPQP